MKNTKIFLICCVLLSVLIAVLSLLNPNLVAEDTSPSGGVSSRSITPTYIEMWSESSSLNPQIPFENCILSDIVVDSAGNTYVSGTFTSEIRFGNITLNTFTDDYSIFIAKLSPTGSWNWAVQSMGENAHSRAMTLDSNESKLYVVGNLVGNNSFGDFIAASLGKNMFVTSIKVDSGVFLDIQMPSSPGTSNAEAVIARSGGGVYIAGEYDVVLKLPGITSLPRTNDGDTNAFVASLSEQGWDWSTSTNCHLSLCGYENATSLTLDHNGNIAVLGVMTENTTFGYGAAGSGPALIGAGFTDVFVWTINPVTSLPINVIGTNGTGYETPAKIISLGEELIISGNFRGQMNLSGINAISYSANHTSGFVASLTIDGMQENWNWVRTVNGSSDSGPTSGRFTLIELGIPWEITDIDIGLDNTIIVGGEYWGLAQLDDLIMPYTGSPYAPDAFVAQLSRQGDWLNMMIVGGPGPDGTTRVATSSNGQMYIGLDSDSVAITFGEDIYYPRDRSVIVGSFEWDRDRDLVSDYNDQCEGYDDRIDEDNDGTPDDCDSLIDSDEDSIPDTSDHCPFIPGIIEYNGCPAPTLVGCTDPLANNYSRYANVDDETCDYDEDNDGINDIDEIVGCMDDTADNFDPNATDPGRCNFTNTPTCPECEGGDTNNLGATSDEDDFSITGASDEVDLVVVGGATLMAGIGISAVLGQIGSSAVPRSTSGRIRGREKKPGIDIDRIGDAMDAYDFIAGEDSEKNLVICSMCGKDVQSIIDKQKPKDSPPSGIWTNCPECGPNGRLQIKSTGGSDHYFKPGVERQGAMSTAAEPILDDYVED
jgi:hypothetical protein